MTLSIKLGSYKNENQFEKYRVKKQMIDNNKVGLVESPSRGVLLRYPALHEVTRSRIGIPASARAKVAAFMHADLVPAGNQTQIRDVFHLMRTFIT